jgi:phosphoglycolate phosphatase
MRYSHIIFDWDGTVMDSAAKIVSCMQLAAKESMLPIPSSQAVRHIIGISLGPAISQLFNISLVEADKVATHYKRIFLEVDQTPSPLFTGAINTLQQLQANHVLGVATGKARRGLERAWKHTDTKQYFDASRCADEAQSKPSPDMLIQLIEHWQVEPESVLMVGDTVYDLQMAETIGMPRLGVSYGVHDSEALLLHSPIAIVDEFKHILDYI